MDRVSSVPRVDPVEELAALFPPRAPRPIDEPPLEWNSLEYAAPGISLLAPWDLGAAESLFSAAESETDADVEAELSSASPFATSEQRTRQSPRAAQVSMLDVLSDQRMGFLDGAVMASSAEAERDDSRGPDGDGESSTSCGHRRRGERRWEESFVLECDAQPFCVMPYVDLELDLVPPRPAPPEEQDVNRKEEATALQGAVLQSSESESEFIHS